MTIAEIVSPAPDFSAETKARAYAEIAAKNKLENERYIESCWLKHCPINYNEPLNFSKIDPKNHDKIKAIVEWKQYPRGLFIVGPTGRAKTRAAWQAIKPRWLDGTSVHSVSSLKLSQDAQKSLMDYEKGERIIPRYVNAGILLLDDLGKRQTTATVQFLFEVIEERTSRNVPIIATSNETYSTLAEKIDDGSGTISEPIIRRLEEFCDLMVLP